MSEKLQKVLAQAGIGSRREVEAWIAEGRIKVNGEVATLGLRISGEETVQVDGRIVKLPEIQESRRVLLYNKPLGEVCTRSDPEGRPTVFDKLPKLSNERWVVVGRLDINTSGLLLFTTDGELANKLMHPSSQSVDREYAVRVAGEVTEDMMKRLKEGVLLEDGMAKFSDIKFFNGDGYNRWYHVVIMEGRNREVRRLFESQELTVSRLKRVRYGCIFLPKSVPVGTWTELGQKDVDQLADLVGLPSKPVRQLNPQEAAKHRRAQQKMRPRQDAEKPVKRRGKVRLDNR